MKTLLLFCLVLLLSFPSLNAQDLDTMTKEQIFSMELEDLLKINVKIATKTEMTAAEAPSIVTVITEGEMKTMGARDLRDVLRSVQGIELGYNRIGYNQIGMRGIMTPNTEKIKFLIDDIPVNEHLEGSGTIAFADMPLENIERIEIIRGPGSALYGTSAFVGVINIITKQNKSLSIFAQGGSFNTFKAGVGFGKNFEHLKVSGFVSALTTEGAKEKIESDPLSNSTLNHDIALAGTEQGLTNYQRKEISANLALEYNNLYFKTYLRTAKKGWTLGNYGAVTKNSEPKPFDMCGVVGYKWKLNEKLSIEPRIYSNYYVADNLWNDAPDGYRVENKDKTFTTYTQGAYQVSGAVQRTIGTDIKASYRLMKKNLLLVGIGYDNMKLYNPITKNNNANPTLGKNGLIDVTSIMRKEPMRTVFSAFAQDQWEFIEHLTATVGVRWDKYNDAGNTVNPRAALVWYKDKIGAKLMYGQAFRAPTFVESYLYAVDGFVVGNQANKPERIKTYELELSYQLTKLLNLKINGYYNDISNLIALNPIYEGEVLKRLEYNSIGDKTVVQGIESELRLVVPNVCRAYVNYSYNEGKSTTNDVKEKLTGVANHLLNAGVSIPIQKYFYLNTTLSYVGKRSAAKTDKRGDLKGYTYGTMCLTAKNFIVFHNLEFTLTVNNLYNQEVRYFESSNYLPNHFPTERINFLLGVNYSF